MLTPERVAEIQKAFIEGDDRGDEEALRDLLADRPEILSRAESAEALLRECLRDYGHPSFTDRGGMADRIRALLSPAAPEPPAESPPKEHPAPCTCLGVVPWHERGCPWEKRWTPEMAADAMAARTKAEPGKPVCATCEDNKFICDIYGSPGKCASKLFCGPENNRRPCPACGGSS